MIYFIYRLPFKFLTIAAFLKNPVFPGIRKLENEVTLDQIWFQQDGCFAHNESSEDP